MFRLLTALTLVAGISVAAPALAQDDGIPVTIEVLDPEGKPIPTAVVRHPEEADRHRVNTETGRWTGSVLYMPDGSELVFEKGLVLSFEVSAPGYANSSFQYLVKKRKNLGTVVLEPITFSIEEDEELEDPVIQFGRDKPLDK